MAQAPARPLRVLAITSGKGGVGKSSLTVNLAITFALRGRRVLIVDGDVGLANVDILLDESPDWTLADVLRGERSIEDVLVRSPHGVTVLPGTSGVAEMAHLSEEERGRLMSAVDGLEDRFDTVLVDTAAGIGSNARFFAGAAQEVLVVATPEPTSLADAYAMIKVLSRRAGFDRVGLVINQSAAEAEALEVYDRLSEIVGRFLPVVLDYLGHIPRDAHVRESVMSQVPVVVQYPAAPATQAVGQLADALSMRSAPLGASGRLQFFWQRLLGGPSEAAPGVA